MNIDEDLIQLMKRKKERVPHVLKSLYLAVHVLMTTYQLLAKDI